MSRCCLLCRLCALLMIHIEAVGKCQMMNEHDGHMPADLIHGGQKRYVFPCYEPKSRGSPQQNAFYALRSCHQILHGDRGEFFSPDYLCSNPPLWCNWTIQVQPGKRVQVYLEDLTPEHMCHLKKDQIHLDESPVSAGESLILERCWRSSLYTSFSNTVRVVQFIQPNLHPPYRGFYGVYQAFGWPETPDLNEDESKEEQVEIEAKDAVTKIPTQQSFSNERDEAHEHMGVNNSLNPEVNEVLTDATGSFREIRKVRGGTKNQEVPFHGALFQDEEEEDVVNELVSVPTGIPNWITVDKDTLMSDDDGPHGPYTVAPTYTTRSISTSTGTAVKESSKKRATKRKPVLTELFTKTTTVNKNASQVATRTPDDPAEAKMVEFSTSLVDDAVSMEGLKTDGAASESHGGGLSENGPNSKKMEQYNGIKAKSLPVQTFRLATEPPHVPLECSRTLVPTLLYAMCFLLCFLITLLMVAVGVMYRHHHHGTFLPRCRQSSSSFTDNDVNNNANSGSGDRSASRSAPPPPPPLRLAGGSHDLPLLRFSPLTPSDGFEGQPQKERDKC